MAVRQLQKCFKVAVGSRELPISKVQFPKIKSDQNYLVLEFKFSVATYSYFKTWIESKESKVITITCDKIVRTIVIDCAPVFIELSDLRGKIDGFTARVFLTPNTIEIT